MAPIWYIVVVIEQNLQNIKDL